MIMGAFELGSNLRAELERIANVHGLEFIRLFGSGLRSLVQARDVDLVVDRIIPELPRFSE